MNALTANRVVCAEPGDCCQPGTVLVLLAITDDGPVELEFCARHAARRMAWGRRAELVALPTR